jgi:6-phosphogluconolactonase (cycloisomerase 2 family)
MAVLRWGRALLLVALVGLVIPAPSVSAASSGIVLTMSNGAKANKVLAWARGPDGSLVFAGKVATGGKGTGRSLGNQGGLTLSADGNWLYVVNPGSDSVSVFKVDGTTMTRTDVEPSRGDKPISVTSYGSLVFVLNAGGNGNIRGFVRDANGRLTLVEASKRPLSGSATKPVQIGFSPSGNYVFVSERATNRLTRYAISAAGAAGAPKWTASAGPEPFGFAFSVDGTLVVSEAGNHVEDGSSASSYRLGTGGTPVTVSGTVPTTETAACWTAITPDGKFAYVTNTPDNSISGFSIGANGSLTMLDADGRTAVTGAGSLPIDVAASSDGDFLYVLTAGTHRILTYAIGANGGLSARPGVSNLPKAANGLAVR